MAHARSARRFGLAAFLVAAAAVVLSACGKPALGGKCTAPKSSCVDAKSGLFCGADGTYQSMTCGGDKGCTGEGDGVVCDNDTAGAGDGCNSPGDGACTSDKKGLLQCQSEKFVLIDTCKGPGSCKVSGDKVDCDNDIAEVGDPCSNKGNFACTTDKATALRCDDGKYGIVQTCRGPKACKIGHPKAKSNEIDCDYALANENDPCLYEGDQACTADKKSMLTCKAAKYTTLTACTGADACVPKPNGQHMQVACDTGPAPNQDDNNNDNPKKHKGKHHHKQH